MLIFKCLVQGTTFGHLAPKVKANRPHQDTLGAKGGQAPKPNGNFEFLNSSLKGGTFFSSGSKPEVQGSHEGGLGANGGQAPKPNGNFDFLNGSIKGGTFSAQAPNLKSKALMREVLEPKGVRPKA